MSMYDEQMGRFGEITKTYGRLSHRRKVWHSLHSYSMSPRKKWDSLTGDEMWIELMGTSGSVRKTHVEAIRYEGLLHCGDYAAVTYKKTVGDKQGISMEWWLHGIEVGHLYQEYI